MIKYSFNEIIIATRKDILVSIILNEPIIAIASKGEISNSYYVKASYKKVIIRNRTYNFS